MWLVRQCHRLRHLLHQCKIMDIIKFASIIVCIVGLIMYLMTLNPKANEVGRIMFAFGLLVTLMKL